MAAPAASWVVRAVFLAAVAASVAEALSLDVHHRYSETVRGWAGRQAPPDGTAEYYAALAGHDGLRRRSLAAGSGSGAGGGEVAFADGNDTYRLNDFGFLHYAVVALGTPNVTFLVALDTGSDLFWVPCDCIKCAPLVSPDYGVRTADPPSPAWRPLYSLLCLLTNLKFDVYSPQKSSTSRKVPCSSNLCDQQSACQSASSSCPYIIQYLSDNTSSSGVLVEDLLYLITEYGQPKIVTAPITFGCGQVQTGSFLGSAAPNGLLGLGMDSKSVPSLLASDGVAANSFSMCFGEDGHETSHHCHINIPSFCSPYYNISITGAMVGSKSINAKFSAIVDSGTSFTALSDPMYTEITSSFNSQVQDKPSQLNSSMPFEFCYSVSPKGSINPPNLSLTAKGGSIFPVNDPIITITDTASTCSDGNLSQFSYPGWSLFGAENFMSGLKVVFDRERKVLGWKIFDCYKADSSSNLPVNPNPSAVPPKPAMGPNSYTPEATKGASPNGTQVNILQPSASFSLKLHFNTNVFIAAVLLLVAVLL
ncbi:Aspartyl protease family protein 1 [Dichanthelium oligosanthes]|uniref:Aspartyl protease family protein 1 n=1 Tax=Dichanthelium oligosanthes TaxID=888268 RepID=A0A1E5WE98_9POAL|nr:Aspartyl protease family protein 1 [Dichanthelium oligosanthes]